MTECCCHECSNFTRVEYNVLFIQYNVSVTCLINQLCYTDERRHRLFSRVSLAPVLLSQSDQMGSVPAVYLWASGLELLKIGRRGGDRGKVRWISKAEASFEKRAARHDSEEALLKVQSPPVEVHSIPDLTTT